MLPTFPEIQKKKPILITGSHRSGTTWVGKILNTPQTAYIFEPFNIENNEPRHDYPLQYWFTYLAGLDEISRNQCLTDLAQCLSYQYQPALSNDYSWHFAARIKLQRSWENFQKRSKQLRPLMKDPIALFAAPTLAETFDMKVICMIRHPLAFCSSIKKWQWTFPFEHFLQQPNLIDDLFPEERKKIELFAAKEFSYVQQAAFLWVLFHKVIKSYQKKHPHWLFIRHEDLVLNPVLEFEKIYGSLDLNYDQSVIKRIDKFTNVSTAKTESLDADSPALKKRDPRQIITSWKARLKVNEYKFILEQTQGLKEHFYPQDAQSYLV
ncbi:hypothetical protein Lepto7376_3369 [[Leptolyngbya] sp. PCC 7376]|uniref:sulfotransferase n=1 Tax=[Leptolyngbya] sp. PCC 7376 TaxID=111781 RepID=UPI00029F4C88|nr:sulfotransferase [[Leptolyngbya] sp. PCC 7376]AFY39581.1 hypothetical protein Lepto7376_3369 [[Leptolyngbya] sp. PCC 7376]